MWHSALLQLPVDGNALGGISQQLAGNPTLLIGAIVLIVAAVLVIAFIKKILVNSVLGLVAWAIIVFVLKVELPLIPSLAVSVIFGLAGIGVMMLLKFLGTI